MRRMLAALALVALAAGEARADVADLLGRRITDVRLVAEGQPVTDRTAIELVETRLGATLRMADVRQTIDHFVTLGRYADIRIYAEADGADAVHLRYEVVPVARAARLVFQGGSGDDVRTLRADLLDRFGPEPAESRLPEISEVVRTYFRAHGFPAARVDLRTAPAGRPGRFVLTVAVTPGRQTVVGAVTVDGPESATAGLLDRLGLVRGRPLDTDTLDARVDAARDEIRAGGYYEAVLLVNVAEPAPATGAADVTVRLNLGSRVRVVFAGDPLPDDRRRALVPIERLRSVEEEVLEDASRNIEQHFRLEGYRAAAAPATRTRANGELRVTFTIARGPLHVVRTVDTAGVVALPPTELEPLLKLREGEPYVDERIGAVGAALGEYYRVRGFANVRVAPDVAIGGTAENGRVPVDVVFRIVEGARSIVRQVRIDGAIAIAPGDLAAQLGLVAGKPFYRPQHVLDRELIERRYRNAGFQRATVTPQITPLEGGDGVELVYTVIEGPRTTVDHVLVTGSTRTDPGLIRREITLRPGAPLGYDAIIESQQRLSALGLFRRVRITEAPHGGAGHGRDVVVEVEDAPATGVTYGGGLEIGPFARTSDTGTATDKFGAAPRGFFQITRRNLFGKNRSISLFASASLRPTDPGVESGKGAQGGYGLNQYRVVGTFREPRAFGTAGDAQLSAFTERGIRSSFNFDRQGVRAEYARRFANRLTALGRYQYDFTTLFDTKIAVADRLLIDRLFPQVHLSSLFGSLLRDSRDDVLDPTKGAVLGSDLELALRTLGSEVGFAKSFGQAFVYRRLPGPHNFVAAAGLRLGLARGFERKVQRVDASGTLVLDASGTPVVDVVADLPASERFFAGGDSTVRGFALDRLGSSATLNTDGFPTGGNGLVVMNAEIRTPHVKGVGLVAFVDSGNVFLRAGDIDAGEFRTTAGLGLRYRSPLGPLRFDIGFKLDRRDFTGGAERRAVYHLSLGQAF